MPLFTNYIHFKQGHMMVCTKTYIFTIKCKSVSLCFNEPVHLLILYVHACMYTIPHYGLKPNKHTPDSRTSVYAHWSLQQLAEEER